MRAGRAQPFVWVVPLEIEYRGIPWPYSLIADYARRQGGELLPGPWERREPPDGSLAALRDCVYYVFPGWRGE